MSPRPQKTSDSKQRLQKVLAAAGVGSRRECEELIVHGRVEIDERVADKLGTRVDPERQRIRVDGVVLKLRRRRYFAVHKPPGVLSTSKDPWGRARVIDLVDAGDRLFAVGRLDKESSGLILVTNDGELANKLTHPRYGVMKTYHVSVQGSPSAEVMRRIRRGVVLAEGPVRPVSVTVKKRVKTTTQLEIVLAEGRNREIRRMLARFEHKVLRLHRIAIGPVRLGMLPRGDYRELTREEVKKLKASCEPKKEPAEKRGRRPKRGQSGKRASKRVTKKVATAATKRKRFSKTPKMGAVIGVSSTGKRQPGNEGGKKPRRRKRSG